MSERVRRFYIMPSSVPVLLSCDPAYTPMTNHLTDVHTVPLVLAAEYDAMAGELDRVSRELSCLQSVIAEPDELNAEPASDYETLRRQYLSLRLLTNSALARNRYLCRRDDRDMRAALSVNAANISAERDTNAMLTDLLERAEAERDALHAEIEALRAENAKLRTALAEQVERQEAVAWVEVKDRHEGPYEFHGIELLDSGKHNLYAAPIAQTAPQPEQNGLVEALEKYADINNWDYDGCSVSPDVAEEALATYRAAQSTQGESHE